MSELFDIRAYLDERGVTYQTSGRDVHASAKAVAVRCPWCDDSLYHLNIYPSGWMQCWRCGPRGWAIELVRLVDACSYSEAAAIQKQFTLAGTVERRKRLARVSADDFRLPPEFSHELPSLHRSYLESRGFDPEHLQRRYGIMAAHNEGAYKFRVIVPIRQHDRVVNFTARDVTGRQYPAYRACPDAEAAVPRTSLLYNLDTVRDTVVVVEGVTDVWRIGDGAVATLGTSFTRAQVLALEKKGVRRVFIFFDSDAEDKALDLEGFVCWGSEVEVKHISLSPGYSDPAELPQGEVEALRGEIFH